MMKNLLFSSLFLLFFLTNVDGQVWFQEGDSWVYKYSGVMGQRRGYEEIWVNGDTLLNGQLCKILESQQKTVEIWPNPSNDTLTSVGPSFFVYEQSDSVFLYNTSDEEFQLIYSFFLDFDNYYIYYIDSWIDGCLANLNFFQLTDTTSIQMGNQHRRVQNLYVSDIDYLIDENYVSVVEGIGIVNKPPLDNPIPLTGDNEGFLIPYLAYPCADAENRDFCSFTSNGETYNPENQDCYALPVPVAVDNLSITPVTYDLYPNPANTDFSVQNPFKLPIKKITIFNANGNVEKMISQPPKEIAISDLAKGIYIVEVEIGDGLVYKKLVKQ